MKRTHKKGTYHRIFEHRKREAILKDISDNANFEWRSCTKKIQYVSLEEAEEKVKILNCDPETWHYQEAYKCVFCEYWHVGRSLKRFANMSFINDKIQEDIDVFYGLAHRASGALAAENQSKPWKRVKYIKRICLRAIKRAQYKIRINMEV